MADIFISYAREDEPTAVHLRDVLAGQGWDVWRDREGILTGTSWEKAIEDALNAAKCVIVVWSRSALTSHFVRDEASVARNANKLVPVQIESLDIPLGFRGIQTANLVGWSGDVDDPEFRKLIRALAERVGARPKADAPAAGEDTNIVERPKLVLPQHVDLRRRAATDAARVKQWLLAKPVLLALGAAVVFGTGFLLARQQGAGSESLAGHDALEQGLKLMLENKYADAEPLLEKSASAGSGAAAFYLGRMYRDGLGVKKDDAKAFAFVERGALHGNALAENSMGFHLGYGRGTKQDDARALGWYFRSADHGYAIGAYNAGSMLEAGRGVRQSDIPRAIDYYRRAADEGIALAGNALGNLYRTGRGIPTDMGQAIYWYRWAADRGEPNAQNQLGYIYANGQGLAQDDARALELYRRAADQNHANAVNNVAYFYEFGRAVPADLHTAAAMYQRAIQLGDKAATINLGRVQEKLRTAVPLRR